MRKLISLLVIILLVTGVSCDKDDSVLSDGNLGNSEILDKGLKTADTEDSDDELVLGKKKNNPFSTKNMVKAYKSLKSKDSNTLDFDVTTNYNYVRILPKTEEEFSLVNYDNTMDVFEFPLDYEIKKRGNKYMEKTIGDSKYTWLYAAVPIDKEFDSQLNVEIIEELFLPFGNGIEPITDFQSNEKDFLLKLENESLILTGNSTMKMKGSTGMTSWNAEGRIRVFDDLVHYNESTGQLDSGSGFVPVMGCLVRANRWFTTKTDLTDSDGTFFIDHDWPNRPVDYSIKWDRTEFDIRSGVWGQAYYNGPNLEGDWDLDIQEAYTPLSYAYAHVHRAAYIYYYNHSSWGIESPALPDYTQNEWGETKIHIGVSESGIRSHFFTWNSIIEAAQVKLNYNFTSDDSRDIFGTAIHELAHTSHWQLGYQTSYYANFNSSKLAESWAQAVGWQITMSIYSSVSNPATPWTEFDASQTYSLIGEDSIPSSRYTPLFIDLIDDYNQSALGGGRPNDQASRYTLSQLEDFLSAEPRYWTDYRNHLRDNSSNPTETDALWLFDNYDKD